MPRRLKDFPFDLCQAENFIGTVWKETVLDMWGQWAGALGTGVSVPLASLGKMKLAECRSS